MKLQRGRPIGVTEVTYYRWRQEYGGLKSDQIKRMKALETGGRVSDKVLSMALADLLLGADPNRERWMTRRRSVANPAE